MTVKNNGAQALNNVEVKSSIPDGTVYVTPEDGYQHSGTSYYKEDESITEMKETLATLEAGKTYSKSYEVRTKSDITSEKQISNKTIATCDGTNIEGTEFISKVQPSNIRVTAKSLEENDSQIVPGGVTTYLVYVENLGNEEIKNLKLQLKSDEYDIGWLTSEEETFLNDEIGRAHV